MKALNLYLTLAALCCTTFLYSQTGFGHFLLGGTGGFDIRFEEPDNLISTDLSPELGFFVFNNFALGGALTVQSTKVGDLSSSAFGISPFARMYFGEGTARLFGHVQVGYITSRFDFGGDEETSNGTLIQVGPGVAFFLNKHVAVEGIFGYTRQGGDFDSSHFGIRFGVQAYLGGD